MSTSPAALLTAGAAVAVLIAGCSSAETPRTPPSSAAPSSVAPAAGADRADRATEEANLGVVERIFATGPPDVLPGREAVVVRTAADGDLVAVHWHETDDPAQPWSGRARIDLFRLAAGQVTQHWGLAQDVPAAGASGNTMFDDAHPAPDGRELSEEDEEERRTFVVAAYDTLFRDQDPSVLDRDFDPDYVQHNPLAGNGTAALAQFFSGTPFPPQESAESLSDGDLVWTFSRPVGSQNPEAFTAGDAFRVVDGKIAEHWDVVPAEAVGPD